MNKYKLNQELILKIDKYDSRIVKVKVESIAITKFGIMYELGNLVGHNVLRLKEIEIDQYIKNFGEQT